MTLLVVDAGNSRVKWGLYEKGGWRIQGASDNSDMDDLASDWARLDPAAIIGSCVSGNESRLNRLHPELPFTWIKPRAFQCGVHNGYDNAERLGPDRWAALIGARALLPDGGLVVGLGTAMTVDVMSPDGKFEGGIIVPGLSLMKQALQDATRLSMGEGHFEFPSGNTGDAVHSGALLALSGAIEKIARSMGNPQCILSGGDAKTLFPHIHASVRIVDNLVLEGLVLIAKDLSL
ncbi:MAG: type III pantothenate kinase [Burkholderiales bacterium]|nr:type III pantothenate kinase [Burkholderiales bacterium]